MEEPLVRVDNISRFFGRLRALDRLSFNVTKGDVLGLLGPNGAGKTTTLRILSGGLAPTRGRVYINGIDLLGKPVEAKLLLGYLPQTPPLYRELNVDEYLQTCARLHGLRGADVRKSTDQIKERCGLGDSGRRLIAHLSDGHRQRVGIAQSIIHNPLIIILDEPTTGLDPNHVHEIHTLIQDLSAEHSILISTNNLEDVHAVCSRVLILHQGHIVLSESMPDLAKRQLTHAWRLQCGNPPLVERLMQLPRVDHAENLGKGGLRVHFSGDKQETPVEALQSLLQAALQEQWQLSELTGEKRSLDAIFSEYTGGGIESLDSHPT